MYSLVMVPELLWEFRQHDDSRDNAFAIKYDLEIIRVINSDSDNDNDDDD